MQNDQSFSSLNLTTQGSMALLYLVVYLGLREKAWKIRVFPCLKINVTEYRYELPSITVISDAYDTLADLLVIPLICVEILNPTHSMSAVYEMVERYLDMGVVTVWIIDAEGQKVFQCNNRSPQLVEELTVPGTDILITRNEIFEKWNSGFRSA